LRFFSPWHLWLRPALTRNRVRTTKAAPALTGKTKKSVVTRAATAPKSSLITGRNATTRKQTTIPRKATRIPTPASPARTDRPTDASRRLRAQGAFKRLFLIFQLVSRFVAFVANALNSQRRDVIRGSKPVCPFFRSAWTPCHLRLQNSHLFESFSVAFESFWA